MATNFPDTSVDNTFVTPNRPWADGDIFDDTAESGLIYYWYDPVWKTKANGEGGWPNLQEVTDEGNTTTNDIETSGDIQSTSQNGGPLAGFRNQIINGDFRVWQRGESIDIPKDIWTFSADRWACNAVEDPAQISKSDDAPAGFTSSILVTGGQVQGWSQPIEIESGNGIFAVGTTWTYSIWCNKNLDGEGLAFRFGNSIDYAAPDGTIELDESVPESNGFRRYKCTVEITGTADPANNFLRIYIINPAGANPVNYTGVQLEPGPVATPFEHRPIGTELALCQRYYHSLNTVHSGKNNYAMANDPTTNVFSYTACPKFRSTPDISLTRTGAIQGLAAEPTLGAASVDGYYIQATKNAGNGQFNWEGTITADAEL